MNGLIMLAWIAAAPALLVILAWITVKSREAWNARVEALDFEREAYCRYHELTDWPTVTWDEWLQQRDDSRSHPDWMNWPESKRR